MLSSTAAGLVWIGRRIDGPQEAEGIGQWWQMPQGGIDGGEDPVAAAKRELAEETAVTSVSYLGETDWLKYDLPPDRIGKAWKRQISRPEDEVDRLPVRGR